jgi:dipeptidyl aminopeptidase/acylaminoacyl peptidase
VAPGARAVNLRLSPDGRHITFQWVEDPAGETPTTYVEFVTEDGETGVRSARPKIGNPRPAFRMGIVRVDPSLPADSVSVTWVDAGTPKPSIIHGPYWNLQGTRAVVQILSLDHKERWISLLDLESGQTSVIDHEHWDDWLNVKLVGGRWSPGYLEWLPGGDAFGFASERTGWTMLYLAELSGTPRVRHLTEGDWEVRGATLTPDGGAWLLTTSRKHPGEEHVYRIAARGGELVRITLGEGIAESYLSPDGRRIAFIFETERALPDLFVQDAWPGVTVTRITQSGTDAFHRYAWSPSEIITFPDPAGLPTWARIYAPPSRPNGAAIVYVHGCGECRQGVVKGWTRGPTDVTVYANFMRQQGYVVVSLDYRGSAGYGHFYRTYAYRQIGITDVDSALPLLDLLQERYGVDPKRIGMYGASYGGFFTLMSLFRHPGRWAAGVALFGPTDWAHYEDMYTSRILGAFPHEDEEVYRRSSPIYHAAGLEDRLQIQHGLLDGNVQVQDAFRLAQALIELGKDFDLVVYPTEAHGFIHPPSRLDSFRRMTRWFNQYLLETRSIP